MFRATKNDIRNCLLCVTVYSSLRSPKINSGRSEIICFPSCRETVKKKYSLRHLTVAPICHRILINQCSDSETNTKSSISLIYAFQATRSGSLLSPLFKSHALFDIKRPRDILVCSLTIVQPNTERHQAQSIFSFVSFSLSEKRSQEKIFQLLFLA